MAALRDGAWLSASDSAGGDGSPLNAESAEDAAPVVGDVGEPVAVAADLLGEHVDVLDAAVRGPAGGVIGEDLGCPSVDRAGEAGDLGDLGFGAVLEEHDESAAGVRWVDRSVDVAEELLSVIWP